VFPSHQTATPMPSFTVEKKLLLVVVTVASFYGSCSDPETMALPAGQEASPAAQVVEIAAPVLHASAAPSSTAR
jgi:hypothetical protein